MPILTQTTRYSSRTDVAAVIVAANNLIQKSQDFDNAVWTKTNSSITVDGDAAPDSTMTADRLVENSASSAHNMTQSVTIAASTDYCYSCHVKLGSGRNVEISVGAGNGVFSGPFDPSAGAWVGVAGAFGGATYHSRSIQVLPSGWYRLSIAFRKTDTTAIVNLSLQDVTTANYLGDGTSNVIGWGAQLELGLSASNYVATL